MYMVLAGVAYRLRSRCLGLSSLRSKSHQIRDLDSIIRPSSHIVFPLQAQTVFYKTHSKN
jgi:hypothetical protein